MIFHDPDKKKECENDTPENARESYVLADASKLGNTSFAKVAIIKRKAYYKPN